MDNTSRDLLAGKLGTATGAGAGAGESQDRMIALRMQAVAAEPSQLVAASILPYRRTIRRTELRQIVPLADTTIYDMERRGEFPRRFNLTSRCVVWDLTEVEAWLDARRQASDTAQLKRAPSPDVRQRKRRPVKAAPVL